MGDRRDRSASGIRSPCDLVDLIRGIPCSLRAPGQEYNNADAGRPDTSSALPGYPRSRKKGGHSGGFHVAPHTFRWRGTPPVRFAWWGSVWSPEGDILDPSGDAGEGCPPPGAESQ